MQEKTHYFFRSKWSLICFFLLGCVFTVCIAVLVVVLLRPNKKEENAPFLFMEYGESFLNVSVQDSKGNIVPFPQSKNDYVLVCSLSSGCKACVEKLKGIGELADVLNGNFADVVLLWQGEQPWNLILQSGIEDSLNYSLSSVHLANGTPHFFILDHNSTVLFSCEAIEDLLEKLETLDGIDRAELQTAADEYILQRFIGSDQSEKPRMIEFSMDGCKDCAAAAPIVAGEAVQNAFEVSTAYCDTTNVSDEHSEKVDYGNILAQIYGIQWYPSFVVFTNQGRTIIGEMQLETLQASLLQIAEGSKEEE